MDPINYSEIPKYLMHLLFYFWAKRFLGFPTTKHGLCHISIYTNQAIVAWISELSSLSYSNFRRILSLINMNRSQGHYLSKKIVPGVILACEEHEW